MTNTRDDAGNLLGGLSFQPIDGQANVAAEPAPIPPDQRPAAPNARRLVIAAIIAYAAFTLLLPLIPYHPRVFHLPFTYATRAQFYLRFAAFHIAPTALFMLLQLWLAQSLVALRWTVRQSVVALFLGVALWAATLALGNSFQHFTRSEAGIFAHVSPLVFSFAITLGLTAFGILLSRIVRERNVLLPAALVAMPIDFVGAMTSIGFTNNVVRRAPEIVSHVSVHVPHVSGLPVVALIGPGDALFIAFFLAAVQRLDMNLRGTFWWMFGLLTLAISEVIAVGFPIGALVPMGIAVLIANFRYFRLQRAEVFAIIYALVLILALVGAFFFLTSRHFSR